jgi:adenylylsulfate kinase
MKLYGRRKILVTDNVHWHPVAVTREDREAKNQHKGAVIWFTGLSGAGKSTLAHELERRLHARGCNTYVLDGDNVRHGLCSDLGFSSCDRVENIRRVGEVSKLFVDAGAIVMAAFISPYQEDRERVRGMFTPGRFIEVYCQCPIEVCEQRDVKGLYRKAREGLMREFTGISAPYEPPVAADLVLNTAKQSLEDCVSRVMELLQGRELLALTCADQ